MLLAWVYTWNLIRPQRRMILAILLESWLILTYLMNFHNHFLLWEMGIVFFVHLEYERLPLFFFFFFFFHNCFSIGHTISNCFWKDQASAEVKEDTGVSKDSMSNHVYGHSMHMEYRQRDWRINNLLFLHMSYWVPLIMTINSWLSRD